MPFLLKEKDIAIYDRRRQRTFARNQVFLPHRIQVLVELKAVIGKRVEFLYGDSSDQFWISYH